MSGKISVKPKKILLVFGTRPEAVKMCPLVKEFQKRKYLHRFMLTQVLKAFDVRPDYDLDVMKERQSLFDITARVLDGMHKILEEARPDMVLVHGDTSTAFAAALAAFYCRIPVGHVEAGLRTYDILSPYPEEFNRQAAGAIASLHFAPTERAARNLLQLMH